MSLVMTRYAENDFAAQCIAQAVLNEKADVISIAYNGDRPSIRPNGPRSQTSFIVFIRADDDAHMVRIDAAIEKAFNL